MTQTDLVNHVQSALKDGIKDLGDFSRDVDSQLVDDGCHGAEDLGLPGSRDVPLVVDEHRLQQGGHKVLSHLEHRTTHEHADRPTSLISMTVVVTTSDHMEPEETPSLDNQQ